MIIITAKSIVKNENINEFKKLANELVTESRKEEGCIEYKLLHDINNSESFIFLEQWKDKEAVERHNNSIHFKTIVPKLGQYREGKPEVNLYEVFV